MDSALNLLLFFVNATFKTYLSLTTLLNLNFLLWWCGTSFARSALPKVLFLIIWVWLSQGIYWENRSNWPKLCLTIRVFALFQNTLSLLFQIRFKLLSHDFGRIQIAWCGVSQRRFRTILKIIWSINANVRALCWWFTEWLFWIRSWNTLLLWFIAYRSLSSYQVSWIRYSWITIINNLLLYSC